MQAPKLQLFDPNIDEAFETQRGSFVLWHEEGGGHGNFAETRESIGHSGGVTLNIRFFKVGKK